MNLKRKNTVKQAKLRIYKVNNHKKTVTILWILLIGSLCFAIYKNFTAVDIHTIHETKIIQEKIVDTNNIECFVENFAKVYYSWEKSINSIYRREEELKKYLTTELQLLNNEVIRTDIPVSCYVDNVQIWSVAQDNQNEFIVVFSVEQVIEGEIKKKVLSTYQVKVYMDDSKNLVIYNNPTICSIPNKSNWEPKTQENDSSIEISIMNEINEFLEIFFRMYPMATAKELSYYVDNGALKPINRNYLFSEIINCTYKKNGNQIMVFVTVKYLEPQTKLIQISQFDLILEKGDNWKIIGS